MTLTDFWRLSSEALSRHVLAFDGSSDKALPSENVAPSDARERATPPAIQARAVAPASWPRVFPGL